MEKVTLTEGQLRSLIENTVREVISEAEMDEGLLGNINAGIKGATRGYKANKALNTDKTDFERNGVFKVNDGHFGWNPGNRDADAIHGRNGIEEMEKLAREYASEGRKLWNQAQLLKKYYGVRTKEYTTPQGVKAKSYDYGDSAPIPNVGTWEKENNYLGQGQTGFKTNLKADTGSGLWGRG